MYKPKILCLTLHECTGCSACSNACPHGYIQLVSNEEGFLYPSVTDQCLGCGLCDNSCPILTKQTEIVPEIDQHAVAAISLDPDIRRASSSGGAFSEICKAYGDQETVVFGARFDGLCVVHSFVIGIENIGPFCKSKYVQSVIGDSFSEAKKFLEKGMKVIFSGTPCQIAGLRAFLGKKFKNLLCIDFICHGVGSPSVFADSLKAIEKKIGKKLVSYSFRNRIQRMGNWHDFVCRYEFEDGEHLLESSDPYQSFFLSQLCLRATCGECCKFRNRNRLSDITISDLKGKFHIFPRMMDHRNFSTIVCNTHKGESVFHDMKSVIKFFPLKMEELEQFNPLFFKTTKSNSSREKFFSAYTNLDNFESLVIQFCKSNIKCKRKINNLLPFHLKRLLKIIYNELLTFKKLYKQKFACLKNISIRSKKAND
ncbi:Coenzyme F420-reducing hydrogenase, beta subunit [Desulfomicrobium apsheronum]|uniref:Coenzyme F420-reducing hydrogenase, beta subunit n=1 Tax=Desulfomicrobium apsheronum TaxID=52560 RepID=A0A1I3N8N0_9BACT|nr:Coenzyme F420 hydrogenase/dehydrogenase, beta subunit C-terminal domain [Desulfomicrobium apsheronum]SFJ05475.1 Coenzyme F420-reducing hydrogenase, beta subunit [Desulfomicrobium apsheronum]